MTANNLFNVLTQIDVAGPSVDMMALVSNNNSGKKGSGDSEYRDALARSLSESSRQDSLGDKKRSAKDDSASSSRSTDRSFKTESSKSDFDRPDATETQKRQPISKSAESQPSDSQSEVKSENIKDSDQSVESHVSTEDAERVVQETSNEALNDEKSFEINSELGTPPAQFQPITITTSQDEDASAQNEIETSSDTFGQFLDNVARLSLDSELPNVGRDEAESIIENLINRFEVIVENGEHSETEQPTPPAGLFQALESPNNHAENTSDQTGEIDLELTGDDVLGEPVLETDIIPDARITESEEEIEFESTPIDVSVGIDATVTTENLSTEADVHDADIVDQQLFDSELAASVESLVVENDSSQETTTEDVDLNLDPQNLNNESTNEQVVTVVSSDDVVLPAEETNQQSLKESSQNSRKAGRDSEKILDVSIGVNENSVETTAVASVVMTEASGGNSSAVVESAFTGTSKIQSQTSSEAPIDQFGTVDKVGATARGGKTNPARTEVNPQKLINKVAEAVRTVGRDGQQLRIQLSPPELGAMQIEVASRNGVLTARIEVQTSTAHQAITENIALLKETLAQNGTKLDQIDVHLNENWQGDGESSDMAEQQQSDQQSPENYQQDDPEDVSGENNPENQLTSTGVASEIEQLDIQV